MASKKRRSAWFFHTGRHVIARCDETNKGKERNKTVILVFALLLLPCSYFQAITRPIYMTIARSCLPVSSV